MNILKKYYEDVCEKRQEALKKLYTERHDTSYRWQDLVEQSKKYSIKVATN